MTWEYKIVLDFHLPTGERALNELGSQGWELVSATAHAPVWRMIFKRQKYGVRENAEAQKK